MRHEAAGEEFACQHCGAMLAAGADFCRSCGASDESGWSEDLDTGDWEEDLDEDYDDFLRREFPDAHKDAGHAPQSSITTIIILLIIVAMLCLTILY